VLRRGLKCGHCKSQWCTNSIEIEVYCIAACTLVELLDEAVEKEEEYETLI